MIDKIKGIINSKNSIDEINTKLLELDVQIGSVSKENSEIKQDFLDIKSELKEIATRQSKIVQELNDNLNMIIESRNKLEREVDDFKIMKNKMQKYVLEQMSEEFRKELIINIERLKTDVASFNELKKEVSIIALKSNKLWAEIDKLTEISGKIRKEDFELSRYAQKLMAEDREKLRLMRQVDALERLISHERRRKATY